MPTQADWSTDEKIIAGLMCALTALAAEDPNAALTQRQLLRLSVGRREIPAPSVLTKAARRLSAQDGAPRSFPLWRTEAVRRLAARPGGLKLPSDAADHQGSLDTSEVVL